MGVKGFNTWFRKQYPAAYLGVKRHYDHLYIDMASFLHEELRKADDVDQFHIRLHARLDKTLRLVDPSKTVVFALDGPAPLAKLLTQRMRRKKEAQKEARTGPRPLSSLGLTPGTPLMAMIQQSLTYYICRRLQSAKWQHLQFELSGATVKGEGEVKILSRLLRPWAEVGPEDSHAVIANDSDVVLMALATPARNVYVLAEPGRTGRRAKAGMRGLAAAAAAVAAPGRGRPGRSKVAAGARGLPMMMGFTCFSVAALQRLWLHKHAFLRGANPEDTAERMVRTQVDMIVLIVLSAGNDYLPALPGGRLKGNSLWEAYLLLRASKREWANGSLVTFDEDHEGRLNTDCLAALLKLWRPRAYGHTCSVSTASDDEDLMVYKQPADPCRYLEGMEWLLKMYLEGECSDYRFTYDAYAPSASQLLSYIDSLQAPSSSSRAEDAEAVHLQDDSSQDSPVAPVPTEVQPAGRLPRISESTEALLPTVCAMALLPGGATGPAYAPTVLQHLMTDPASPVADLYQDCPQCSALSQASARASAERDEVQEVMVAATKALAAAQAAAAAHKDDSLEAAMAHAAVTAASTALKEARQRAEQSREVARSLSREREEHVRLRHPYAAFPVDRLEAAVNAVPLDSFPVVEREAAVFGPAYKFWYRSRAKGEAATSHFTPPDAPFAAGPGAEPSRMIEREEIPDPLPLLEHLQAPAEISDIGAVGEEAASGETSGVREHPFCRERQGEPAVQAQPLQAAAGKWHLRRQKAKAKPGGKVRWRPHSHPKSSGSATSTHLAASAGAAEQNGATGPAALPVPTVQPAAAGSASSAAGSASSAAGSASSAEQRAAGAEPMQSPSPDLQLTAVTESGLTMTRPARRMAAAAAPSARPQGNDGRQKMEMAMRRCGLRPAPFAQKRQPSRPSVVLRRSALPCQHAARCNLTMC